MRPAGLVFEIVAQNRCVRRYRPRRIDECRQFLIFDFDKVGRVGCDITVLGQASG
jgi:hypothetical protein